MLTSVRQPGAHSRRWAVGTALILLFGLLTVPAAADPARPTMPPFNLDTGNAPLQIVYPAILPHNKDVSPTGMDATLIVDYTQLLEVAWFDSIAPFHPTAVGINSRIANRPAAERTDRNRNIAVVYASYSLLRRFFPQFTADWRTMVSNAGLNPDDTAENRTTAAGIGNLVGRLTLENRAGDGLNRFGEEGSKEAGHQPIDYNRQRYADYTNYEPVNTAYDVRNPSRWQPAIFQLGNGLFAVQQFATPQMSRTRAYTFRNPREFTVAPPTASDHRNRAAYKAQADAVLRESANLTDPKKMTAEFFNDKLRSLGEVAGLAALQGGRLGVAGTVNYIATNSIASFDATIATWYFKRKFDTMRPPTAVRHLYGDRTVTAWGGPGKGTVSDIKATEWKAYLPLTDHPEYPSGSSAICGAFAESSKLFLGTDRIDISVTAPAGSSLVEPGITPKADTTLTWHSWTDFAAGCRQSRSWGGVHFTPATDAVASYAPEIGRRAYALVQRHLRGQA